ncbi:tryptophan synthase subunit alpha [Candidatus Marinamargulisbacteria bacterium SCGC AG-333-B06]|nr:tryptophan synthase subunit alpha [Candidatus Marinamargulisbacteria bacterium SCGC AG-333-B06]
MSNNLAKTFEEKALIAYVTLGDPSWEYTVNYCKALIDTGISMIEIGLPFSDPIADGPIIQASHQRALASGEDVSVKRGLALIDTLKDYSPNTPLIIMSATNLIMQYGYNNFFKEAASVGCDGLIMPDASIEMATMIKKEIEPSKMPLINIVSPLCTKDRLQTIVKHSEGFIYVLSSTGITGERDHFSATLKQFVLEIKAIHDIPVAIGFGISQQSHCQELSQFSDGIIIGSHFVKIMQDNITDSQEAITAVCTRVKQFKAVL